MRKKLIECGPHGGLAPWHVICVHLVKGTSKEWTPIALSPDDSREVDFDWLCPSCAEEQSAGVADVNKMRAICMHCVRELRGVK